MTPFDDNDLIDRLQSGIAERQAAISVPDGIGDDARRAARKRTATRAVGAGVPVLAAAGVASVLAISSSAGSPAASGTSAGDPGGSRAPTPAVSGPPVKVEDTAYIVTRVKAKVADSQGGTVIHDSSYASGHVSPDGSPVNLGWKIADGYDYAAPDGTEFWRTAYYDQDGSPYLTATNVLVPDGNGKDDDTRTIVNPARHTYNQTRFSGIFDPKAGLATTNLYSSSSAVRQALQSGRVTRKGTATVNGTPAIALFIKVPSVPGALGVHLTLYVDAQTYQPLRTVTVPDGHPDLLVADWIPATPGNIAQAKGGPVPAGYEKVDKAY